jgi:anti-sigma regulatory factor (Ser/Thr protein kinase)
MAQSLRADTGHAGRIGLGDHACQFFVTAEDLSQTLIPYFKMGLEQNQACVWVTAPPYPGDRALSELRQAVPHADRLVANGQLQIYSYDEWYLKYAELGLDELVRVWLTRAQEATAAGYAGLRISGNGSFVAREAWPMFMGYEKSLDTALYDQPIAALCSYWLKTCEADDVLDVLSCHSCGWAKHQDRWEEIVVSSDAGRHRSVFVPRTLEEPEEITQLMEELLHTHAGKVRLEGSPLWLSATQGANLRLIITELAANAAKHGALARPEGKVCVQWSAFINGSRRLRVCWTETSSVSNFVLPDKVGAGTHLLARAADNVERVFEAGGMSCSFELSLEGSHGRRS